MGYTPAGSGGGSSTTGATDNPFAGNVPWPLDPESRRETRRAFGNDYTGFVNALNTENKRLYDYLKANPGANNPNGPGSGGTSVTTSTKQFTLQEAKGLAVNAFQDAVGREMTADELKKFTDALNKAEKASPTKTKTTSHSGGSNSVTSGGMDEAQFATDFAQQNPEYAGYQKATTYFDAMASALRGIAGGSL